MNTSTLSRAAAAPLSRARLVLGIFKLRIALLIMVTALGGMAIVPGGSLGLVPTVVLALSVLLASAAAGAFNQFVEADSDRLMKRTRTRAFASGALPRNGAWLAAIVALLMLATVAAALVVNVTAAAFTLAGALTYALLYTLMLKRRTAWNIVVGGAAGSFAVLAGAAAVNPQIGPLAWLLALVLFLWTPPHFWSLAIANAAEYEAAGVREYWLIDPIGQTVTVMAFPEAGRARQRAFRGKQRVHSAVLPAFDQPAAAQGGLIRDSEIEENLREFCLPIWQAANLRSNEVSIYIVNDPSLNAFVAGGENIFVHTGLILAAQTRDLCGLVG